LHVLNCKFVLECFTRLARNYSLANWTDQC